MTLANALIAIGLRKSALLTVDREGCRTSVGSGLTIEGVGACRLPNGGFCVVGHSNEFVGAIAVSNPTGEKWSVVGRNAVLGGFNGFYAAHSNEAGLFVAGTPFKAPGGVLRGEPRPGTKWVFEPFSFGHGALKLVGHRRDVFAMVLKNGALGSGDSVAHRDPDTGTWRRFPGFPGTSIVDIATAGPALLAVGDEGVVYSVSLGSKRKKWATLKLPWVRAKPWVVGGGAPDDLFVGGSVGDRLFFAHFDGTRWAKLPVDARYTPRMLLGLASVGPGSAIAGGSPRHLFRLTRGAPVQVLKAPAREVCLVVAG